MKPKPPPDNPLPDDKQHVLRANDVYLKVVGKTNTSTVECLAEGGAQTYRFDMPGHTRVLRQFWKLVGVKKPKQAEGAFQHATGLGPFLLEGTVVGTDELREGEEGLPTSVLADAVLKKPEKS